MKKKLSIALGQLEISTDPAKNIEKVTAMADQAASGGADWVVFPEMTMGLPVPDRRPIDIITADSGAFVEGVMAVARQTGQIITVGGWEAGPDDRRAYNTVYTIAPDGRILAAYRKIHLFDALSVCESDVMTRGATLPPVIDLSGIRIGFAICYDLRFPELFRYLADQGVHLVIVPSAWYQGPMKEDHWLTLLRARAIENTIYVAGCNLVGSAFCGRSIVFDPFGVPLAGAGEEETLVISDIRPKRVAAVRDKLPCLKNRRRDLLPG